jgi:hypothetical protein
VRGFEQDVRRLARDLAVFAAHDAGDAEDTRSLLAVG